MGIGSPVENITDNNMANLEILSKFFKCASISLKSYKRDIKLGIHFFSPHQKTNSVFLLKGVQNKFKMANQLKIKPKQNES